MSKVVLWFGSREWNQNRCYETKSNSRPTRVLFSVGWLLETGTDPSRLSGRFSGFITAFLPNKSKTQLWSSSQRWKKITQLARNCRFFSNSFKRSLKQKPGPAVLWFWCFSMKMNRRFFYFSKNWNWWFSDAPLFQRMGTGSSWFLTLLKKNQQPNTSPVQCWVVLWVFKEPLVQVL